MKRLFAFSAAASLMFALTTGARAESIDMAAIGCQDLLAMPIEEVVVVGAWMSGYFNAKASNTVLDLDRMDEVGQVLGQFCQDNPDTTVMKAVEQIAATADE